MGAPSYPGTPQYQPYPPYAQPPPSNEKPTAAFVLSLIGGIFTVLWGGLLLAIANLVGSVGVVSVSGAIALVAVSQLVFGILMVILGTLLYIQPEHHVAYGVVILVISIISLVVGLGGLIIGFILGLIGGILGIVWRPTAPVIIQPMYMAAPGPMGLPPPAPIGVPPVVGPYGAPAPSARVCMRCGRAVGPELKFCPYCGSPLA